uniref:VWA domain-containing protein n=1 Tax=Aliarcobacter sp. TaxID=2321116 RepID=UPI004048DEAF
MLIPSFVLMYFIIVKKNKLINYFSKNALKKLSVSNRYFSNKARNITLFLSLIFMIIALARPVTNEKINDIQSNVNAIIIAIDVSKSMNAIDIYPNRLEFAKNKLLNIIDNSKNEAIGLILFAKSSFLLSAPTQNYQSLKILINNLDTGINFDNGTNIFSTLETTTKLLKDYSNKNLILLTDGGDNESFEEEIKYAIENKINVYTLALATLQGSVIKTSDGNYLTDSKGNIVNLKLNENIKELSLKSAGGYIDFSLDNNDINQIIKDINNKSKKEKFDNKKYKTYTELFYYPLIMGIFLLLIAFSSLPNFNRIKKTSTSIVFLLFLPNYQSFASSIFDFKIIEKANTAYKNSDYITASKEFKKIDSNEFRDYNLANSLYKSKDYKNAIDLYKNIETNNTDLDFKRLHNLGNAYVKNNDFKNAINSYENALKLKNDKKTKENLELIKKSLENTKDKNSDKQENQNNEKNKNNEKKSSNKNNKSEKNQRDKEEKKETKKNEISDLEEERWMKELENQKTNSLLKKMESSKEDSISKPW